MYRSSNTDGCHDFRGVVNRINMGVKGSEKVYAFEYQIEIHYTVDRWHVNIEKPLTSEILVGRNVNEKRITLSHIYLYTCKWYCGNKLFIQCYLLTFYYSLTLKKEGVLIASQCTNKYILWNMFESICKSKHHV